MEIESKLKAANLLWWKLWHDFDWDALKKYFETLHALRAACGLRTTGVTPATLLM